MLLLPECYTDIMDIIELTTNTENEKRFNDSYCDVNVFCDLQLWSSISWYCCYKDHLKVQENFYGNRCVMPILNYN